MGAEVAGIVGVVVPKAALPGPTSPLWWRKLGSVQAYLYFFVTVDEHMGGTNPALRTAFENLTFIALQRTEYSALLFASVQTQCM